MAKEATAAKAATSTELVKPNDPTEEQKQLLKALGMGPDDQLEKVQSGGVTKWLDLAKFMADPKTPQGEPCKANGKFFAGGLLGVQEMEDEDAKEENADGVKVRYFYNLKLITPCPVTWKNENGERIEEEAQPGDIIAVGERHSLKEMRTMATDGGVYVVVIKPHSRIKINPKQTMWTFDMWRKVVRPAVKIVSQGQPVPF